ncbi:cytochrome P450 [Streptosporangium sp. NPDC001559]|uniref:cytochrome P450 n=1 Tax=Streptosporangium sp. NPDC001559 TaxID=3366187 RepID=UPI0036E40E6B
MTTDFPISRTCPFSPPDEYERLREQAPLVRARIARGEVWLVTRHAEAQQVLSDPTVSTDPASPGHPMPAMRPDDPSEEELKIRRRFQAGQFIDMDPPEHSLYRRMLIPEFTVRRVKEMRPAIQEATDLLIDDMLKAGSPTDLVDAFGFALPSMVTCTLLGVPYADRDFFRARTRKMMDTGVGSSADGIAAAIEVWHYLDGLITEAEGEPGDDLIGRLVTARRETGELTHDALVGMVFLLLIAGHETTANMIPLGVHTLLRHPDQLAALRADPTGWPFAVEELLRYHSIVDWVGFDRVATRDMEIGGQAVRAGEGMFVLGASANRDPRVFDRPDDFDIRRGARNHLAFGYGVHQCLGQNLARAELEIAYRALFDRLPALHVIGDDADLPFNYDGVVFGTRAFPVGW